MEGRTFDVRVWIDTSAVAWARETPAFGFEHEEPGEGGSMFVFACRDLRRLLPWVLSWGASARVLSPPDVVDRIRQEADEMAGRYASE
jgi:predicted DNA-binding transcriptional regulator YafY